MLGIAKRHVLEVDVVARVIVLHQQRIVRWTALGKSKPSGLSRWSFDIAKGYRFVTLFSGNTAG